MAQEPSESMSAETLAALGFERMMDAIRTGEVLFDVLRGLMANKDAAAGAKLAGGGLMCIIECYAAMRASGMTVTCPNASLQSFMDGSRGRIICEIVQGCGAVNQSLLQLHVAALCSAVSQVRKQISFSDAVPKAINVEPLPVRLVSMPERITTMSVARDPETLEITSTTQRQVDASQF